MSSRKRVLQVFLNYASPDRQRVLDLYQYLTENGVNAWIDVKDLLGGQKWEHEIQKVIKRSDIVLVCMSKASIGKDGYVQKEIRFALEKAQEKPEGKVYIIPVRLESCRAPDELRTYQWVDLFKENGSSKLLEALITHAKQMRLELSLPKTISPFVIKRLTKKNSLKTNNFKKTSPFVKRRLDKKKILDNKK